MRKVDLKAFTYVLALSETHLLSGIVSMNERSSTTEFGSDLIGYLQRNKQLKIHFPGLSQSLGLLTLANSAY